MITARGFGTEAWTAGGQDDDALAAWAADAMACERRLAANALLPADESRYSTICARIERYALENRGTNVVDMPKDDYLGLIERAAKDQGNLHRDARLRVYSTFFPPEQLHQHLTLLRHVAEASDGPVVSALQEAAAGGGLILAFGRECQPRQIPSNDREDEAGNAWIPQRMSSPDDRRIGPELDHTDVLVREFNRTQGDPDGVVNLGQFSNQAMAEALQRLAYEQGPEHVYRIRYQDGSIASDLRLHCLIQRGVAENAATVRAALLSHRHLALDENVDFAWFRNREVSTERPHAEIEADCFATTERMLSQHGSQPLRIVLYQTGFPPAVVGFYRGLIEILRSRSREARISVLPIFFVGGREIKGTEWT